MTFDLSLFVFLIIDVVGRCPVLLNYSPKEHPLDVVTIPFGVDMQSS